MTFFNYLRDQYRLILLWFIFVGLTSFILWLTPEVNFNLPSLLYILLIGILLLLTFLGFDFNRRTKWWLQLEVDRNDLVETPRLTNARSNEEILYQDYFNELQSEQFALLNEVRSLSNEQKDYIDSWVHEIKVPLASLKLISENIEDDVSEKRYNQLRNNLKRIDDYVDQVLYYSRLDSFSKDYLIKSYSLKKIVQQTVKQSADYFIQKNIRFSLIGDDHHVLTDEKWLVFILNQLISNALKYSDSNSVITVELSKNERGIWLSLTDTGIGIPPEDLSRIFNKGFTGNNGRNEETNSTGLGLYLAKSLTEKLGHNLYVESQVGQGTTFRILFPHLSYYADTEENFMIN
ncbi:sensor histidine kinase [Vagococcus fluvialis]|uniref:sensor histidine kinase n=1 Tax=Vagococcus fluvialis TaxID=2738 RepID=UPI001A8C5CDE|nr:sensor histidine kinase [Vagococcus fluvialis]MBO0486672.1 sensor histidine kinase [Vagococcus fluvialis]